jgi:hypothetical protein
MQRHGPVSVAAEETEGKLVDKCDYLGELAEKLCPESGDLEFGSLTEPQQIFLAVWDMDTEVSGGGFDQFLRCCDSSLIAYTPTALRAIGAAACAAIVERAIALIEPLPAGQEDRFERLDDIGENGEDELIELDEAYDSCPEDIIGLLFAFVAKHPLVFGSAEG